VSPLDLKFFNNHKFELSGIGLIVTGILLFISTIGVFLPGADIAKDREYISETLDYLGNWDYWLFIGSIIFFLISLWIFTDFILKLRKFNNYIETASKSTFKKKKEEIKFIAWELGDKFVERYEERKKEFRIRD
jgi:hypothetical protein